MVRSHIEILNFLTLSIQTFVENSVNRTATRDQGKIRRIEVEGRRAKQLREYAMITVEDNGEGFSP